MLVPPSNCLDRPSGLDVWSFDHHPSTLFKPHRIGRPGRCHCEVRRSARIARAEGEGKIRFGTASAVPSISAELKRGAGSTTDKENEGIEQGRDTAAVLPSRVLISAGCAQTSCTLHLPVRRDLHAAPSAIGVRIRRQMAVCTLSLPSVWRSCRLHLPCGLWTSAWRRAVREALHVPPAARDTLHLPAPARCTS